MQIQQIPLKEANIFIVQYHRHHRQIQGYKFSIGLYDGDNLVGCAVVGRASGRKLDNKLTCEVTRLCLKDGIPNGCSMLLARCARIAKEMGYTKILTFILQSESGVSLKASGWMLEADNVGKKEWNSSKGINRTSKTIDLFGVHKKYPNELKQRWVKLLKQETICTR
jgi:hypothetical protein